MAEMRPSLYKIKEPTYSKLSKVIDGPGFNLPKFWRFKIFYIQFSFASRGFGVLGFWGFGLQIYNKFTK